jgi:hypothetical protein
MVTISGSGIDGEVRLEFRVQASMVEVGLKFEVQGLKFRFGMWY